MKLHHLHDPKQKELLAVIKNSFLGIDIGSVSVSFAVLDHNSKVVHSGYNFHKGRIAETLQKLLGDINFIDIQAIGYTSSSKSIIKKGKSFDARVAYITAVRHFHPNAKSLLIIGAEKFGLVTFNEKGEYSNYKSNSSCAAGTGNFLDQQAERLNLQSIQEFSKIAFENKGKIPLIASRCAVFAKTDLIHAQQEGFSLSEICDGLSYGLAKNVVDTVFKSPVVDEVVAAGGVALNQSVISHIEKLTNLQITVDEYAHVYGAIGAAMLSAENEEDENTAQFSLNELIGVDKKEKKYVHPPLQLKLSTFPDFGDHEKFEFHSATFPLMKPVEVDLYSQDTSCDKGLLFLGIDIGSTSTKAVLIDRNREVLAGFYTRTSGQPLQAVQVIFEAICAYSAKRKVKFTISGTGTTGSGRKFTGKIIGADLILDEITAHARAAYELDKETDTIIEIGGQDSKFTSMRNGLVTFSVMNNVCAAGTGSFIEEQAKRLGCALEEYAQQVEEVSSPMASDRCTVFMEQDLNHYLMAGYSKQEILAAVLHSTCENYFSRVASKVCIGNRICFQGATAKNKALVAAMEQKLQKPIMVSKFCHLTGALGVALELLDQNSVKSTFRGLELYKKNISVRSEVCELCTNHCKLKVADIDDQTEAYGFLCGRDYHTHKFIRNKSLSFQLIQKRKELFRSIPSTGQKKATIGIPAGLHLFEEIPFWQKFFDLLSFNTITSDDYLIPTKDGKNLCGAEFCAPIAAMHGHVDYLNDRADFIFLPVYFEEPQENNINKQYCYYTQFVSSIIAARKDLASRKKILTPLLKSSQSELFMRLELYKMFKSAGFNDIGFLNISMAYEKAKNQVNAAHEKWKALYVNGTKNLDDIHIMLLGRPYTVLSPAMNNSIPDIIEKIGIHTFFMDILPSSQIDGMIAEDLIRTIKWKFASKILHAAELVARTENCYPVLVTSFKCSPDSFVVEYFKEVLDYYRKPYLILQLDDHSSTVGYETRIEAAVRSFRNHRKIDKVIIQKDAPCRLPEKSIQETEGVFLTDSSLYRHVKSLVSNAFMILKAHSIDFKLFNQEIGKLEVHEHNLSGTVFAGSKNLGGKTLLLPAWDSYVGPLLEAVLKNSNINARLVDSSAESIQRSLSHNTGQCLPLNIIVQDSIDYIESKGLDPANTAVWMMKTKLSCNLAMFPWFMKKLLEDYGKGMEQVSVYVGDVIFFDFSLQTAINAYLAYMFGGYIRKIGCTIRPYEKTAGNTDAVINQSLSWLRDAFLNGRLKEELLEKIVSEFEAIPVNRSPRARVAIFGDLYVRDNDLMNQNLIKTIEENGGEVITTPYSEYMKIIVDPVIERSLKEGHYKDYIKILFLKALIPLVEDRYKKYFARFTGETDYTSSAEMNEWLNMFGLSILHKGESFENILKIHSLITRYPDLNLFVQTNPSYCCPSLVTEAMKARIEEATGVPVLTIEYDGTGRLKNEDIIPYLKYRNVRAMALTKD